MAVAALAAAATYASVQRRERRRLREHGALIARELAAGYVDCTTYAITDAVAVEEHEDEGPSYYLLLDDGRTLFLSGQYLYEPADEDGFPWAAYAPSPDPSHGVGRGSLACRCHAGRL